MKNIGRTQAGAADRYIARPDGNVRLAGAADAEGWLWDECVRALDRHDPVGRKIYDFAAKTGGAGVYRKVKHYAFSRHPPSDPLPEVEFVTQPFAEFGSRLRAAGGKNIWMMGGAEIMASFLHAGGTALEV